MNLPKTLAQRSRLAYGLAAVFTILLGLLWRSRWLPLPGFLAKYGGDALWSVVVFFALGTIFIRASTLKIASMALVFSWSIEFLQLYHAPWIDSIRSTLMGRLVLGSTFNSPDLIAYLVGIAIGVSVELALAPTNRS